MSLDIANLFPLLTSDITLKVHVSKHCRDCRLEEANAKMIKRENSSVHM